MASTGGFEIKSGGKREGGAGTSRIAFRRQVPEAIDFDDVEEKIIGTVTRRKKDFVTGQDKPVSGAMAKQLPQKKGGRGSGAASASASSFGTQPGSLSPLQGVDLGKGERHQSLERYKHYGAIYGEHGENPVRWLRRNLGKANAAAASFVQTLHHMVQGKGRGTRAAAPKR
ncbi:hypothetical protein HOP50_04g35180 [Chloropicon primus]|uniref:Uncharacterized protein n=2 Tax=Chloropicon primus TaxID=1764295 RepID=A0A5B8MKL2_9CHLO|nr:hypothetical protein A3770_04p35110 [Chloropicon primus]UPR00204.1 hypothetical protein HOP50_04g35180 [Chloropicon primus]|eukprot:QDZ20993.1 hypothetical protein A3770_04p35110 [Chloropicon primus]